MAAEEEDGHDTTRTSNTMNSSHREEELDSRYDEPDCVHEVHVSRTNDRTADREREQYSGEERVEASDVLFSTRILKNPNADPPLRQTFLIRPAFPALRGNSSPFGRNPFFVFVASLSVNPGWLIESRGNQNRSSLFRGADDNDRCRFPRTDSL